MEMAAALVLLLLLAAPAVHAVDHTVGGGNGWSQSTDLSTWASSEKFTVGDTLVFNYAGSHSVAVVSKDDYENCNVANPLKSYDSGPTTIKLDKSGPMYFICSTTGHCQSGMKLAVNVAAAAATTPTSPATQSPPSGSSSPDTPSTSTPNTPPATTSTASPSPPSGGAARSFGDTNHLMLGFSVFVAALFAFMG